MSIYMVTVETEKGEVFCSYEERDSRDIEVRVLLPHKSLQEWRDWIKVRKELFPWCIYHIYEIYEI